MGAITNATDFASVLGCSIAPFPIMCLGLPLGAKSSSKAVWNPMIERASRRQSSRKGRYLSKGGKLTMVKSVLSSLPIHFLSLFKAPVSVVNQLERI